MHTTHDYRNNEKPDSPKLWIIHNSDWSGICYVTWTIKGREKEFTYTWNVDGDMLLSGVIMGTQVDNTAAPVPIWVIGRAVALAVHTMLIKNIISYMEQQ